MTDELQALSDEYGRRRAQQGGEQQRGQWFNGFLARLFHAHGIEAYADQHGLDGRDELDVTFRLDTRNFLMEAKWTTPRIDVTPIAKLRDRLEVRPPGVYGVMVSMAGYTDPVLERARYDPRILLLDRQHIDAMVSDLIAPAQLFDAHLAVISRHGGARASLAQLLRPVAAPDLPQWQRADAPDAPTPTPRIEHAAPGVTFTPQVTAVGSWFSPWTGMASAGDGAVLLTCEAGIARVGLAQGSSVWQSTVPGCFGPVVCRDGELLAVCGNAVISVGDDGAVTALGGPLDPRGALVPTADGLCAFCTAGPPGPVYRGGHRLIRLGGTVGAHEALPIDFAGQIRRVAATGDGQLYIASGYHGGLVKIGPQMALPEPDWFPAAPLSELGTVVPVGEHTVISAGRDSAGARGRILATDLRTRQHTLLLELEANQIKGITPTGTPGEFHVLLDVWGHASAPRAMLAQLTLPPFA